MLKLIPHTVDILILGAGWTSTFLINHLEAEGITHAETTTSGREGTIPFKFDSDSHDLVPYQRLPQARTVLITFPLIGRGASTRLCELYQKTHGAIEHHWIQLGSTGIFNQGTGWISEESDYDSANARAVAEDELRTAFNGCVLNLAGLYGHDRKPSNWLGRVAKSKDDVRAKKAVHFIHGEDVARAISATHRNFTPAKRWLITDMRVYDWWDLILSFSSAASEGQESEYATWIAELMEEHDIKALPRDTNGLGRRLDSRRFWKTMNLWPEHARLA
ncbi:hypothetical protein BU24DRAFT_423764 [Aaosphaeria arxii CBS 175.79]|uniref:NAD(P)-binding protein n=1 Tax=Aaosphaeria arxii CBS 175.79 TaxID=1450172 RepID=A0A6A5XPM0_9PLEO|nr:uncharacterized protein BU24DRAFT_423764 [Aaosphaeria arxii CBS 175.79]KAF2014856.1 hypothetical protein BU24DRAFT_423764 [Aaosphaeria arxii CBS 175.79]